MSGTALAYDENLNPSKERRWTYADYKDWDLKPGERFELIDGVAYAMAAPNTRHQLIVTALTAEFVNFLRGKPCQVIVSPFDVRLFYEEDESDDMVVQPDLVVVCDPAKLGKEGCRGAPDLVIEILSPSNTATEMNRKFRLYRRAGVREYWVLDPEDKTLDIHRFEDGQTLTQTYGDTDVAAAGIIPGLELNLAEVFVE